MDNLTRARQHNNAILSPICREIRSKKLFHLTAIPTRPEDIVDASNHCWCRVTQQVIGPDGSRVRATTCNSGRECYKSYFDFE